MRTLAFRICSHLFANLIMKILGRRQSNNVIDLRGTYPITISGSFIYNPVLTDYNFALLILNTFQRFGWYVVSIEINKAQQPYYASYNYRYSIQRYSFSFVFHVGNQYNKQFVINSVNNVLLSLKTITQIMFNGVVYSSY